MTRSSFPLAFGAVLCMACSDAPPGPAPRPQLPLSVRSIRVEPLVAAGDELTRLVVSVTGASESLLLLHPRFALSLTRSGIALDSLTLYDDGTHGDDVPRDGFFTLDSVVIEGRKHAIAAMPLGPTTIHEASRPHSEARDAFLAVTFRWFDPALVPEAMVDTLAVDARATGRVANLVVPDPADLSESALSDVVSRYYELFQTTEDYLVVLAPPTASAETWSARTWHIQNDEAGLGLAPRRFRDWTETGPLATVVQSRFDGYTTSPSPSFCLLNHEITHRWAAYLGAPLDAGGHWSEPPLGRATTAFGDSTGCIHNDLELYLAGLLPQDSVAPVLTSSGMTIHDVVQRVGARSPAWPSARRVFTITFIVLSERGLTDREFAYFDFIASEYLRDHSTLGVNWHMATGARSRMMSGARPRIAADRVSARPSATPTDAR